MSLDHHGRGSHSNVIHFFTIFGIGEFQEEQFRIPRSFVERYWKDMSNPIYLTLPNDVEWKIFWTRRNDDIWFHEKNWKNFAKSLKKGYLLVFKYQRRSGFKVLIFDPSLLEIDYSNIRYTNEREIENDYCIEDERPTRPLKKKKTTSNGEPEGVPSKKTNLGKKKINVECDTTQQNVSGPSERDMVKAKDCSRKRARNVHSESPSFTLKLKKSYIQRDMLAIPSGFWRKYLDRIPLSATATIGVVGEERAWNVGFHFYDGKQQQMFMINGWKSFCQHNNLKVDDQCEFVMNQSQLMSFTITINRDKEQSLSKPKQLQGHQQNTRELGNFGRVQLGKRKGRGGGEVSSSFRKTNAAGKRSRGVMLKAKNCSKRSSYFCSENPFFTIEMQPTYICRQILFLPSLFSRKYLEGLEGSARIGLRDDRTWAVRFFYCKATKRTIITSGWASFSRENNLQVGDNCLFEMTNCDSDSHSLLSFKVTIQRIQQGEDPTFNRFQDSESPNMEHNKFKVTINPYHLKHTTPYIRKEFMKGHAGIDGKSVTLQVRERRWHVKVKYYPNPGTLMFSGGWRVFARDCELQVGDICEFEMIDEDKLLLKVSIKRQHHCTV